MRALLLPPRAGTPQPEDNIFPDGVSFHLKRVSQNPHNVIAKEERLKQSADLQEIASLRLSADKAGSQ
jgi:hypothetical protein